VSIYVVSLCIILLFGPLETISAYIIACNKFGLVLPINEHHVSSIKLLIRCWLGHASYCEESGSSDFGVSREDRLITLNSHLDLT
jgi:hypothetical protein